MKVCFHLNFAHSCAQYFNSYALNNSLNLTQSADSLKILKITITKPW